MSDTIRVGSVGPARLGSSLDGGEAAMRERRRSGLALIELVSASAILMLLVAFQFPALMRSREAARRSQCVNNLKQIGLATHNYVDVFGAYPMSAVVGSGHGNGQGCFTQILPYLEQVAVYNAYNFSLENSHLANTTAMRVKMNVFLCPSNTKFANTKSSEIRNQHDKAYRAGLEFAAGHYGANWGGVRAASGAEAAKAYPGSHLGVILTVVDPDAKVPTQNIKLKDITDGTSNTLAYAEKLDSFGWGVGGWGGTEFYVNTSVNYEGKDAKLKRVFTGSLHPGGINVGLADGAVMFLRNDFDRKMWYGTTTRNRGEFIKFD